MCLAHFAIVEAMRPPSPKTINLLVALLCLLWGSTWVVIREGLKDLPVFTSAASDSPWPEP